MTLKQVDQQIAKELETELAELEKEETAFYNAKYEGGIPKDLVKIFSKAMFALSPKESDMSSPYVKEWIKMSINDLNFAKVFKMSDVITSVPKNLIFADMNEACDQLEPIEVIFNEGTKKITEFKKQYEAKQNAIKDKLQKKKYNLMKTVNNPGGGSKKNTLKKA